MLPFDWARERQYDLDEIRRVAPEYLTADEDILSTRQTTASLELLAKQGRVIRAYRKTCHLTIGESSEHEVPVLFCEGDVPAILGRAGVFEHFYFGMSARLSQWQSVLLGDVMVWERERLLAKDWEASHASVPTVDMIWWVNGQPRTISMAFDSGAEISVYGKEHAEKNLRIDFSTRPVYERQAALLTRTMRVGQGHYQPGVVK